MTASPADPSRTEFRTFLQSPLWDERDQAPLSPLSALARLDVDPWEQAAVLAGLEAEEAKRTLRVMLARLPGAATCADFEALCERAVTLLPRVTAPSQLAAIGDDRAAATPATRGVSIKVVLLALGMMIMSVVASERWARPSGPMAAPAAQSGSMSEPGGSATAGQPVD